MKIGQLVRFYDHEASGGFAPSPELMGMIISMSNITEPSQIEVLCFDGTIVHQWSDELEVIT